MIFGPWNMHKEMEITFNVAWKLVKTNKAVQFGELLHVL